MHEVGELIRLGIKSSLRDPLWLPAWIWTQSIFLGARSLNLARSGLRWERACSATSALSIHSCRMIDSLATFWTDHLGSTSRTLRPRQQTSLPWVSYFG